jgi:hypothetical protein
MCVSCIVASQLGGYLLVIAWGGVTSAPRFVSGAAIITIADSVVMAIGLALFSKVITPAFQVRFVFW